MNFWKLLNNDKNSKARTGIMQTGHKSIETPVFMPVGTLGGVKAILNKELYDMNVNIILGNTYHLFLRPGIDVLTDAMGLHKFMNWKNAILTDSGGFQIYSLANLKKTTPDGVEFSSHLDGTKYFFTPEKVIEIQRIIGSDIMMPLDECLPIPTEKALVEKSVLLTNSWEKKCYSSFINSQSRYEHNQVLFSICQGGVFKDLRKKSIESLLECDFDGNAIGGLAVGEPNELMYELVDYCSDYLPIDKPRYLMGVGTPIDILESVEKGVDMFDCVMPTRNARHGRVFTTYGEINIRNSKYKNDFNSPDPECHTYTSDNFSLSYLRHLFISGEILGMQLASLHNIGFYIELMKNIRDSISKGNFKEFKNSFINKYTSIKN